MGREDRRGATSDRPRAWSARWWCCWWRRGLRRVPGADPGPARARPETVDYRSRATACSRRPTDVVYPRRAAAGLARHPGRRRGRRRRVVAPRRAHRQRPLRRAPSRARRGASPWSRSTSTRTPSRASRWASRASWRRAGGSTPTTAGTRRTPPRSTGMVLVYGSAPADGPADDRRVAHRRRTSERRSVLVRASIAASSRCRAPSSQSWQIVASSSPRSHSASDSSRRGAARLEACAPPR